MGILALTLTSNSAYANCWEDVGARYKVDPLLLKAIAWKESRGKANAVGPKLKDGNRALGMMQINTIHLPQLATRGISKEHLFDPCTNQEIGAWVLSNCIRQFGNTWKAVGCYYTGGASKNTVAQTAYVKDVQRFYRGYLLKQRQTGVSSKLYLRAEK
jgi:soluble lytic murein transglycosylase-like protein